MRTNKSFDEIEESVEEKKLNDYLDSLDATDESEESESDSKGEDEDAE